MPARRSTSGLSLANALLAYAGSGRWRQHRGAQRDLFGEEFLLKRPLLQAIDAAHDRAPVLLIDEVDRADQELEAFLLELLSDFQVTVPNWAPSAPNAPQS